MRVPVASSQFAQPASGPGCINTNTSGNNGNSNMGMNNHVNGHLGASQPQMAPLHHPNNHNGNLHIMAAIAGATNSSNPASNSNSNGNGNSNGSNLNGGDRYAEVSCSTSTSSSSCCDPLHTHASMLVMNNPANVPASISNHRTNNNNNNNNNNKNTSNDIPSNPQALAQQQQHSTAAAPAMYSLFPATAAPPPHALLYSPTPPAFLGANGLSLGPPKLPASVSTIVTGPNGQPMILGPTATATLLQPATHANAASTVNAQPFLTSAGSASRNPHAPHSLHHAPTALTAAHAPLHHQAAAVSALPHSTNHLMRVVSSTPAAAALHPTNRTASNGMPIPQVTSDASMALSYSSNTAAPTVTTSEALNPVMSHIPSSNEKNSSARKLTPEEKRRQERNLREQQRSHRISQQIRELKNVLVESNVPFKPNKFNVLMSVVEYIKQLQARAVFLDGEHQKLIQTIQETTNYVQNKAKQQQENNNNSNNNNNHNSLNNSIGNKEVVGNDADLLFVQGLDYKAIFAQGSAPLGVAALDGRFLACNAQFQMITGYSKEQLNRLSLFNLVTAQDVEHVFKVMGEMLKQAPTTNNNRPLHDTNTTPSSSQTSSIPSSNSIHQISSDSQHHTQQQISIDNSTGATAIPSYQNTYWTGSVSQHHNLQPNINITMNITLARTDDGSPKFFNCALSARS